MAEQDIQGREPRDAIMQRVRVGLTGLAAVFLLTLLAASIFNMLGQDEPHGGRLANGAAMANGASDDSPREPLAELGVAPGGTASKSSASSSRPGEPPTAAAVPPGGNGRPPAKASPAP